MPFGTVSAPETFNIIVVLPYNLDISPHQMLCRMELVKLLPVHQYSVDIFSYSGPSGILGSDRKQNTA